MKGYFTKENQGLTTIGKIEVSNNFQALTYRFIKEEPVSYYSQCSQTNLDYIEEACKQLEAWEYGEICFTTTPPDYKAMLEEETSKLKKLNRYTSRYNFSLIINNSEFNEAMAGNLLLALTPYPEEQKTATIALEKIRWLTNRLCETRTSHISLPSISEDEDTIMLRQQIEVLDLPNAGTEGYPLLYTLKDAWHARNKPWAADNAKFAVKTAPILQKKEDTVTRGLNRACIPLRKSEHNSECYPLATLVVSQISVHGEIYKKEALEKWNERYQKVQSTMSMDITKTSTGKSDSLKKRMEY